MMNANEQSVKTTVSGATAPEATADSAAAGEAAPLNSAQEPQTYPAYQQPPANPYAGWAPPYQPQAGGTPVYPVQPQPKAPKRGCKSRDLLMALLVAIFSFVMVDCVIWGGGIGLGFAVGGVVLLSVNLWYLKGDWRHIGPYTVICIAAFFVGCASLIFSADGGTKVLTLLCLMTLYSCILMDGMELREWAPGSFRSAGDFFYTGFALSFGRIGQGLYGLFHPERDGNAKRRAGVGKALLGLLIALPVAVIVLVLLSSADRAFQGMLDGIDLSRYHEKLVSLVLAAPMFIALFSQLFCVRDVRRAPREESGKGMDSTVLAFFLIGVSLVYVAYLFSQLAYFFNGFMGFLPTGFTYAQYARRGFFELSVVSVINSMIVILGTAFARKQEGRLPLRVKLPCLFLCLFSLVLVATEVTKLKLYMDAYGLTRLRVLTTLFMVFLAVVFLALMIRLCVRRFPYMKAAVIAGVALLIAVNLISVDRLVAEYNVQAYQSGVLQSVDVKTITRLGDAAVPSLLKLAEDQNPQVAKDAQTNLYDRWKRLHHNYAAGELKSYDYRGFNLTSYRARQLLLENEKLFLGSGKKTS